MTALRQKTSSAILVIILATGLSACASVPLAPPPSSVTAAAPPAGYEYYAVKPGETLWRIARRNRIDIDELVRLNRIADARRIETGQRLLVPTGTEKAAETNFNSSPGDEANFSWPVEGKIVAYYREREGGVANKGIDILAAAGAKILATRGGRVAFIGRLPGYGTTIVLDHGDGFASVYSGIKEPAVRTQDPVTQGMVLAFAGDRTRYENGRVHFEIRRRQKPQNPLFFLN
ncbi:MAG: murein hydrolase activator EnvC family protein [Deltaproteobacteria bacterium]